MRKQTMEELAALYGLEINETEPGKGGLFYEDSEGNKMPVMNINALLNEKDW